MLPEILKRFTIIAIPCVAMITTRDFWMNERRDMREAVEQLKSQFETLTNQERAELAYYLICSLKPEDDLREVDTAWEAELTRRVADIKQGRASGKPADQVFAELREQYS